MLNAETELPVKLPKIEAITDGAPPICFVVRFDRKLQPLQRRQLVRFARSQFEGTPHANVPVFALDDELTFEVLRAPEDVAQLVERQEAIMAPQFRVATDPLPPQAADKDPERHVATSRIQSPSRDN